MKSFEESVDPYLGETKPKRTFDQFRSWPVDFSLYHSDQSPGRARYFCWYKENLACKAPPNLTVSTGSEQASGCCVLYCILWFHSSLGPSALSLQGADPLILVLIVWHILSDSISWRLWQGWCQDEFLSWRRLHGLISALLAPLLQFGREALSKYQNSNRKG